MGLGQRRKIGVIGYGHVGKATRLFFQDHYQVLVHDPPLEGRAEIALASREQINACDLAVISVPTPSLPDGTCDLSAVQATLEWVETPLIVLKSTVPVGTTDELAERTGKPLVFSPEFCGESSYWTPYRFHSDLRESPFYIFGGKPELTRRVVDFYLPVAGPVKVYRQTNARAAEMAKYVENSFYATKIAFCYEMAAICEALALDYHEVRDLWLLDPRVNPMHTAVFPDNELPFSGKCLPKDVAALTQFSREKGHRPWLLEEVLRTNRRLAEQRSARAGITRGIDDEPPPEGKRP